MGRNPLKLSANAFDLLGIYAYADTSHARDRVLWRGFLSSVLSFIFPQHIDNIDIFITNSLTQDIDELVKHAIEGSDHAMRTISTNIAESIGVPFEFALASFYDEECDINLSTKLYKFNYIPVKKHTKESQEESMISEWLTRFNEVCNEKKFIVYIEMWKDLLS